MPVQEEPFEQIHMCYQKREFYHNILDNKRESEFSHIPRANWTVSDINTLKTFQYQVFSVSTGQGLILSDFEYIDQYQPISRHQFIFTKSGKINYEKVNLF